MWEAIATEGSRRRVFSASAAELVANGILVIPRLALQHCPYQSKASHCRGVASSGIANVSPGNRSANVYGVRGCSTGSQVVHGCVRHSCPSPQGSQR
eukprot:2077262-Rhodomonas_salina.2